VSFLTQNSSMIVAKSRWVWNRKWTFVRFIFTISRYLPFFGIGMTFAGEQLSYQWILRKSLMVNGQLPFERNTILVKV
jgi:hypothetical protein